MRGTVSKYTKNGNFFCSAWFSLVWNGYQNLCFRSKGKRKTENKRSTALLTVMSHSIIIIISIFLSLSPSLSLSLLWMILWARKLLKGLHFATIQSTMMLNLSFLWRSLSLSLSPSPSYSLTLSQSTFSFLFLVYFFIVFLLYETSTPNLQLWEKFE